jgi:hypothetical protein
MTCLPSLDVSPHGVVITNGVAQLATNKEMIIMAMVFII